MAKEWGQISYKSRNQYSFLIFAQYQGKMREKK